MLSNIILELCKIFIEIIKDYIKLGVILIINKNKSINIIYIEMIVINIMFFFLLILIIFPYSLYI